MRAWIAVMVVLGACGGNGSADRCERAFDHLNDIGVYGGDDYGTQGALALGMACKDLTPDDFACLDHAKSKGDLVGCTHAAQVVPAMEQLLQRDNLGGAMPDAADANAVADALCACTKPTCLVGVGEHNRDVLQRFFSSIHSGDSNVEDAENRMRACVERIAGRSPRRYEDTPASAKP